MDTDRDLQDQICVYLCSSAVKIFGLPLAVPVGDIGNDLTTVDTDDTMVVTDKDL